jgi:hypothetical protein
LFSVSWLVSAGDLQAKKIKAIVINNVSDLMIRFFISVKFS